MSGWQLSGLAIVRVGNCPGWQLSGWQLSGWQLSVGNCPVGICPLPINSDTQFEKLIKSEKGRDAYRFVL